jgi:hypothetical protein
MASSSSRSFSLHGEIYARVYLCFNTPYSVPGSNIRVFILFKLNKHYQIKIGLHNLYMSSSYEIIRASKLRGEPRALSTSGIGTRTVVPTCRDIKL